jgi:endonuclease YncB( thermonuclease family)
MAKKDDTPPSVPSFGTEPAHTFVAPKFHLQDSRLWHYRCFVLRVIDGDTVVCLRDLGTHKYDVLKVRLAGVDAPEMRPRVGTPAERTAEKVLAAASTDRLKELVDQREIVIRTEKTGKYGRWLAYLYVPGSQTLTANQVLLDEGHAVVYGTPRPWRAAEAKKLQG